MSKPIGSEPNALVDLLRTVLVHRLLGESPDWPEGEMQRSVAGFSEDQIRSSLTAYGPVDRVGVVTMAGGNDDRSKIVSELVNNYAGRKRKERSQARVEFEAAVDNLTDIDIKAALEWLKTELPTLTEESVLKQIQQDFDIDDAQVQKHLSHLSLEDLERTYNHLAAYQESQTAQFGESSDRGNRDLFQLPERAQSRDEHDRIVRERTDEGEKKKGQFVESKHFNKSSEAIRKVLRAEPGATPKQVIEALGTQGINVTKNLVKQVRRNWRQEILFDLQHFADEYPQRFVPLFDALHAAAYDESLGFNMIYGKYKKPMLLFYSFLSDFDDIFNDFAQIVAENTTDRGQVDLWLSHLEDWKERVRTVWRHSDLFDLFIDDRFRLINPLHPEYAGFNGDVIDDLGLPGGYWLNELQIIAHDIVVHGGHIESFRRFLKERVLPEFERAFAKVGIGLFPERDDDQVIIDGMAWCSLTALSEEDRGRLPPWRTWIRRAD